MNDAHSDLTVMCYEETNEINEYGNQKPCGTELSYEEHFKGLARKPGWEGKALRLVCDECGSSNLVCPVCHGGGWYRGEQTRKQLACHVCNIREYQRQQMEPSF